MPDAKPATEGELNSLSRPFGFSKHLKENSGSLDFIPLIDLIVVGLFVSLMFTRFVVLPGVKVDLPATDLRISHGGSSVAVLTIGANEMLFFDNGVYDDATVGGALSDFVGNHEPGPIALLVKVQSAMEVQSFLEIIELAERAGFDHVQIVGQKKQVRPAVEFGVDRVF